MRYSTARRQSVLFLSLLFALALSTAACSKSPQAKITGTWAADFLASLDDQSLPQEQQQMVAQMAQNVSLTLAFAEDGTLTITLAGLSEQPDVTSATWEVVGVEGNTVNIRTTLVEEGETERVQDLALAFESDTLFRADFNGRMTVFSKQ